MPGYPQTISIIKAHVIVFSRMFPKKRELPPTPAEKSEVPKQPQDSESAQEQLSAEDIAAQIEAIDTQQAARQAEADSAVQKIEEALGDVSEASKKRIQENTVTEPKQSLLKRLARHPLAKPLLVAGALHLPLNERVGNAIESAGHAIAESVKNTWEKEHMVLHPQSKEQQAQVSARVAERGKNVDAAAREAYKTEAAKRLEGGEPPSLKRMQFDLEKLGGIPAAEVESAEKRADEMIAKYSSEVGDDLTADEIKRISTEMYGPDSSYKWEQASTTRYFNGGDRNCVAISRAQGIVMEGVLAHLPPEKRVHWRPATQMVKQHEMAAVEHLDDNGNRDALYILEGGNTRKWAGTEAEPGTVTLPMTEVKKALVSSKPVEAKAAGNPGEVKNSADIDVVTDEPAKLNVRVVGKLKGSEFVMQEAKREGLEPEKMTDEQIAAQIAVSREQEKKLEGQVTEIEILVDVDPAGARLRLQSAPRLERVDPWTGARSKNSVSVDARDLDAPSPETVAVFDEPLPDSAEGRRAWRVNYGTMENWRPEAVSQALRNRNRSITVAMGQQGRLSEAFLRGFSAETKGNADLPSIKLELGKDNTKYTGEVDADDLRAILSGEGRRTVDISDVSLGDFEKVAEVIRDMPDDKTVVMPNMNYFYKGEDNGKRVDRDGYLLYGKTKGKVLMPAYVYQESLARHPELLDNRHYLFDTASRPKDLAELREAIRKIIPDHPLLMAIDIANLAHEGMTEVGDEQGHIDPYRLLRIDSE